MDNLAAEPSVFLEEGKTDLDENYGSNGTYCLNEPFENSALTGSLEVLLRAAYDVAQSADVLWAIVADDDRRAARNPCKDGNTRISDLTRSL